MDEIKVLDVVAITEDLPNQGLRRGEVGTVVDRWKDGAYEVEFSDRNGRTYQSLGLRPDHFMILHYEPERDLREPVSV